MKLSFNGSIKEAKLNTASHRIKNIFIDKLSDISETARTEKLFGLMKSGMNEDEANKAVQEGLADGTLSFSDLVDTAENIKKRDKVYRELAFELVNQNQLTTKEREIFNDDVDSEFWLEQDYTEIKDTVDYFRTVFGLQNF